MTDEQKKKVKEAKGSTLKKVLWWCLGILGLIGVIVLIVCLLKRKGPITSAKEIINKTQYEIDKIDLEAKAKTAQAEAVEAEVVDKIKEIAKIENEHERNKELAALLEEDY